MLSASLLGPVCSLYCHFTLKLNGNNNMINKKIYSPLFYQSALIVKRQTLGDNVLIYFITLRPSSLLPPVPRSILVMVAAASSSLARGANKPLSEACPDRSSFRGSVLLMRRNLFPIPLLRKCAVYLIKCCFHNERAPQNIFVECYMSNQFVKKNTT